MRKIKIAIFIAALIIGLIFAKVFGAVLGFSFPGVSISAFSCVKGSGVMKTEKREVAPFKQIDVSGAIEVNATAQKDFSVEVEADDNLLEYVKTEVSGDTLKIYTTGMRFKGGKIKVSISLPELTGAEVSGASKINANQIKTESFKLNVSGASKIEVSGEAKNLLVDSSGASKINAENLKVANANVDVSGATSVTVNAIEEVKAEASGASKVSYVGEPKNVVKDTSGASKVLQK